MQTGPGRRCRLREGGHANPNTRLSQARIALASRAGMATTSLPVTVICTDPCPTPQLMPGRVLFDAGPGALHRQRPVRAECWAGRFRCRTCALAAWPSVRDALGVQHGGPRAQCLTTASGCYGSREDILLSLFVSAQSARPAVLCEKQASHPLPKGNGALMRNGALML